MKKYISILLVFFCFHAKLFAINRVIIPADGSSIIIGKYLSILEDEKDTANPNKILFSQAFKPSKNNVPNLGFTQGAFWLKFEINNPNVDSNYIIQINQSLLDEVTFYEFNENGKLLKQASIGEKFKFSERKYQDQYLMFETNIEKNKTKYYLIKVKSGEQILMPVQVGTITKTLERNRNRDLLFGIYFGIILVMMAYNFFIYLSVRDKSYLYYVGYIFFVGFTQAVLEGYTFKFLWPNNYWLASRSVYYSTTLVCISSLVFLRFFLHTKEFAPKLDKLFWYIFALFSICIVACTIEVNWISHNIAQAAVGMVSFYIFASSYVVYKKGYPPAKYFFIAWFILVVGIFIFVLKDAGIIEANILTTYSLQFGSVVEVVLLSFALADRINILKKEKEASQAKAFEVLKENEKLIKEQNIILEQKVIERTLELENTNNELYTTLTNLKETQAQLVGAEKMASLGQLTAGIAHEINNPINFVKSNVKPLLLDMEDLYEVIRRYEEILDVDATEVKQKLIEVEKFKTEIDLNYLKSEIEVLLNGIEDGAKRTAEIVTGLKNFSRLDETDVKLANINEGIESTLILLRNEFSSSLKPVLNLGDIPIIECLPGKLNQVFMNLFNNAIFAIKKKKSTEDQFLTISTFEKDDWVVVTVEDTGIGMSEKVKEKVFEPFFTTKDVGEGTGLGMSIVFKIIETHQGKIEIDSEEGKGTKISIYLKKQLKLPPNTN